MTARESVEARYAATIILLRDGDRGPEVFMMKRHIESDFVGGAYVFPGGSVDPEDSDAEALATGLDDGDASRRLQIERGGLAFFVAAIRECFEEAGVLFAYDENDELVRMNEPRTAERYDELRARLNAGEVSFLDLARDNRWRLAVDRMHYWAHWITPEGQPKRYDTRFFLATAPADQVAVHDDRELTDSAWVTPSEAIAKGRSKEWMVIFPTLRNLMTLTDFASTTEAEEAGRSRGAVEPIQPRILRREGGIRVVAPGDPGWDDAGEARGA